MHTLSTFLLCQCIFFCCIFFSALLRSTLSFYLSTMCSYLSLHLFPAMGLCPFIIHGSCFYDSRSRVGWESVRLKGSVGLYPPQSGGLLPELPCSGISHKTKSTRSITPESQRMSEFAYTPPPQTIYCERDFSFM